MSGPLDRLVPRLRPPLAPGGGAGLSDGHLLERFVRRRDAAALEALARRHGPMVWGVCRRLLGHHDAEDAFQATFLVLVRKAAAVRPSAVANWLYGVAHRTALKARATLAKQGARERQIAMPEPRAARPDPWDDLRPVLDHELSLLPEHSRAVIVLCDLEGRTRKEAARELGLAEGTVASRLARARVLLARRLVRHGLVLTGGALAAVLAERAPASVPALVMSSMLRAASLMAAGQVGLIPANVAALTEGVVQAMLLSKLKAVALSVVVVVAGVGAGGLLYQSQAAQPPTAGAPPMPVAPAQPPGGLPAIPPAEGSSFGAPPPTPEQLRSRYLQLQEELSRHMTAVQVRQRVEELEKEVAAAREREQRALREKQAAAELEKIRVMLGNLAAAYPETEAGAKARRAFELTGPTSGPTPMGTGLQPGTELTPAAPPATTLPPGLKPN